MKTTRWLMALPLAAALGCAGDLETPVDASQSRLDHSAPSADWPQQPPDGPAPWPDGAPADSWSGWSDTGYSGSPFGCQRDSDCFGLECCPTPWGVKLCAKACQPR